MSSRNTIGTAQRPTPVEKKTSIGMSTRSRPTNKSKKRSYKKYNRQGK